MAYRNNEGYRDPTAGEAVGAVAKEERKRNEAVLKDKETGKEYR